MARTRSLALFHPSPRRANVPLKPLGEKGLDPVVAIWVVWDNPPGFSGWETLGKPNNTAILLGRRPRGKRVLAPFALRRPYHSLLFDFCLLLSPESAKPGPRQPPVPVLSFSARADVPPSKNRRTKLVVSDRGFCSGASNGDRVPSAYRNPPTIASPPHRHALNSPSVFLFSQG